MACWSFAKQASDLFDEELFWIQNSKWPAPLVCLWIILSSLFATLGLANWGQGLLAIRQVTQGVGLLEFFYCWLLPCTDTNNSFTKKVSINEVNLLMGRTIFSCVWGLLYSL